MMPAPDGATPLDPDELDGLLPQGVLTRADLDLWEQQGVLAGRRWAFGRGNRSTDTVLSERFLRELHRRMFNRVWQWAGTYRTTDKNVGVHWPQIAIAMRDAINDTHAWIGQPAWPPRELAARFHHRLVTIHPFPNGNGRWSRLATDALMWSMRQPLPTWGASMDPATVRQAYLDALRAADRGAFEPLVEFVWS